MTDLAVTQALYPTRDEIRAQILGDIRYEGSRAGITYNVKKGSELWHRATAFANRVALAIANNQIEARDVNPLRATGEKLIELCKVFGVSARPATKSFGPCTIAVLPGASTVNIPIGFRATSPDGWVYETTSAYPAAATSSSVAMRAVDAGAGGDQDAGTILTWDSGVIAFLAKTLTVGDAGIDGGADEDGQEVLRQRLLRRLAFPQVGGNWSYVNNLAETTSTSVSISYVYETLRGPSTYDVAIQGDGDEAMLSTTVQDIVSAGILADMPGSANLNVTTVEEEGVDVIVDIGLSLPPAAGGIGGGWTDVSPWPSDAEPSAWPKITNVAADAGQVTVSSTSADPPAAGNRFGVWIPDDLAFVDFTILSVGGSSGAYVLTLDTSATSKLTKVTTDMYCSAWAEYMQEYGSLFHAACQLLGPGEKTEVAEVLKYARRRPPPDVERPFRLTALQLYAITSQRAEVSDIAYAARFSTTTTTTKTEPTTPAVASLAPNKLKLVNLAFRRRT